MTEATAGSPAKLTPTGDIRPIIELGIKLQEEASQHHIHNVFDDGGYKELILLRLFRLRKLAREGHDAVDANGRYYEIKTVARVSSSGRRKTSLSVTTEHTLTKANITRYRRAFLWIVAVFDQSRPEAIYEIAPAALEPFFTAWETKLDQQQALHTAGGAPVHLNNPKIPLAYIAQHGVQVWPPRDTPLPRSVQLGLTMAEEQDDS
jgi:hypothetical protein